MTDTGSMRACGGPPCGGRRMAKAKTTLADALHAAAKATEDRPRNGLLPWYRRLPAGRLVELEEIRDRFERGEFGKLSQSKVAEVIMLWGADHELAMPKRWAIIQWLTRKG